VLRMVRCSTGSGTQQRRGSTLGRKEKERDLTSKLHRSQAQAGSEGLPLGRHRRGDEEDDVVEGEGE
jgi:hypothetical protein